MKYLSIALVFIAACVAAPYTTTLSLYFAIPISLFIMASD
jgi:hypothetical protein